MSNKWLHCQCCDNLNSSMWTYITAVACVCCVLFVAVFQRYSVSSPTLVCARCSVVSKPVCSRVFFKRVCVCVFTRKPDMYASVLAADLRVQMLTLIPCSNIDYKICLLECCSTIAPPHGLLYRGLLHSTVPCLFQATCCPDKLHCCPQGFRCQADKCVRQTISVPATTHTRHAAKMPVGGSAIKCPDSNMECPDGTTCCEILKTKKYGCCPKPNVSASCIPMSSINLLYV